VVEPPARLTRIRVHEADWKVRELGGRLTADQHLEPATETPA
jgi:hypothetical protein